MTQELSQSDIDKIVNMKLNELEREYEMIKKYDDPNYKGLDVPQVEETQKPQDDDPQEPEEEEQFQDYQGYEQLDDNDEEAQEPPQEQLDFDAVEHIDPLSQPLDVERIKSFMAQIELPTPGWAMNEQEWQLRFGKLKENQ